MIFLISQTALSPLKMIVDSARVLERRSLPWQLLERVIVLSESHTQTQTTATSLLKSMPILMGSLSKSQFRLVVTRGVKMKSLDAMKKPKIAPCTMNMELHQRSSKSSTSWDTKHGCVPSRLQRASLFGYPKRSCGLELQEEVSGLLNNLCGLQSGGLKLQVGSFSQLLSVLQ